MRNFKKIIAAGLALATVFGMTACNNGSGNGGNGGNGGGPGTLPDVEVTAPPIDTEAETGTIKWLMYEDLLTNNAEMVALFESRYNGKIEQETCGSGAEYFERIGTLVQADLSPDIVRYEWMTFPHGVSYNMYTPIDDYIDFSSDLWKGVADVAEQFVYNGKHYYAPYQLKTNFALNYNKLSLQNVGLQDPMELLKEDKWTWSAFTDLITRWCDLDPENVGYTGVSAMSFIATTGTKIIDVSNGKITNNMQTENVSRCMQWLETLCKENLTGEGYVSPQDAFVDGKLLFLGMDPSWTYGASMEALNKLGIESEMAFVPFPRDDNSTTYYHAIDTFGYMIPAGAKNVKGAIDWINLNRIEETDEENIAKAKDAALSTAPVYYPKCANKDCGDTSENADDKGKHIFTEEENESGVDTCPVCGTARKEKFHASYTEEQYELLQELKSTDGRFTMLFDNVFGFGSAFEQLFQGTGEESLLDGPLFHGSSYTTLSTSLYNTVESYLQPYRDKMAEDAAKE